MLCVPTALLKHRTPAGDHHDWLVGTPADQCEPGIPGAGLWTARVGPDDGVWGSLGGFEVVEIPMHRRAYLTYEGPIGGGRGSVSRVDEGLVVVRQWRRDRMVWDVRMRRFRGLVEARRIHGQRWRVVVL